MIKKTILVLLLLLLLTSCVKVSENAPTNTPIVFVTSTLPPTKPGLTLPTPVPPTATPTRDPLSASPTPSCHDEAVFVEDVTYPDNTRLTAGEKFTKTWKFKDTGTCAWKGYTVAFVSGDRMEAPDSVAVPDTNPQADVEISIDLVAPPQNGAYTGNFKLLNADGEPVPIGIEKTFWVKIIVGEEGDSLVASAEQKLGNCIYTENPDYVKALIDLLNKARADVGRAALTTNPKLMDVAQAHSLDMACNNFLRHSGSDGLWVGDRLKNAGYTNPYYLELLAIGLPQDAMNQWHNDKDKNLWNSVITSRVTEIGVGYAFSKFSAYGGYWTVDMGGP